MREYKISKKMLPYVTQVLERDIISYQIGEDTIQVPLSGNKFHIIVEDAACEMERKDIPVYSLRTILNQKKFRSMMHMNECGAFHVLQKDMDVFMNSIA